ncbi:MAG: tRNA epoxyqueuosine(34) reductase QueG [Phycisphaerales bacterium]|nr:MAG: tRNA epoxyqueuosine(34) reductase QueG [Phycisphaerales bacterium]
MSITQDIKHRALELGFDLVGVTDAAPIDTEQKELLAAWLESGYAGQMTYMQKNFDKRINPAKLLRNARSVIAAGLNYKPLRKNLEKPNTTRPCGKVASYAQYQDYHPFVKQQLHRLVDFISSVAGSGHRYKICVDSAPVAERTLAVRAGLGFIGRNHLLIHPTLGPQMFLGEVITTVKLRSDEAIGADCSDCDNCIAACPTGALLPDGQFDARKCINYLTIEHEGKLPLELRKIIGDRLFGCEECIVSCPYHKNAPVCKNADLKRHCDRAKLDLHEILALTDESFAVKFTDSVINRSGLNRLKRNARICLENIALHGR